MTAENPEEPTTVHSPSHYDYSIKNLLGEPVAFWAALQALVAMAIGFGWLSGIGLSGQDAMATVGIVLNALAALHLAFVTHRTLLAPFVELFKALALLGVIYGVHISDENTALVITAITAVFAAFHRSSVSPTQGDFDLGA